MTEENRDSASPELNDQQEQAKPAELHKITYKGPDGVETDVMVYRAALDEPYIALKPPDAEPYIMAPKDADVNSIVNLLAKHVVEVEELRGDMRKRFEKSPSEKCRYMTGDIAYVMGRPFQLRVYPLGSHKIKGARGRATSKFSVNYAVSLLTLYVVHTRNYDEAKAAFSSYAERVILTNADRLVPKYAGMLMPEKKAPAVRMRSMRGRWSSLEAGALWLSKDLVPYPPECLVLTIWRELASHAGLSDAESQAGLERVLPDWRSAQQLLSSRPKPYSNQ